MRKTRLSAAIALVLVGGLAGCQQKRDEALVGTAVVPVEEERAERDEVPVSATPQPNHHFSPFYGGYVPFFVPIGGYSGGMSYRSHYHSLSPNERAAYPPPRSGVASRPGGSGGVAGRPTSSPTRGGFGATGRSGFSASS